MPRTRNAAKASDRPGELAGSVPRSRFLDKRATRSRSATPAPDEGFRAIPGSPTPIAHLQRPSVSGHQRRNAAPSRHSRACVVNSNSASPLRDSLDEARASRRCATVAAPATAFVVGQRRCTNAGIHASERRARMRPMTGPLLLPVERPSPASPRGARSGRATGARVRARLAPASPRAKRDSAPGRSALERRPQRAS